MWRNSRWHERGRRLGDASKGPPPSSSSQAPLELRYRHVCSQSVECRTPSKDYGHGSGVRSRENAAAERPDLGALVSCHVSLDNLWPPPLHSFSFSLFFPFGGRFSRIPFSFSLFLRVDCSTLHPWICWFHENALLNYNSLLHFLYYITWMANYPIHTSLGPTRWDPLQLIQSQTGGTPYTLPMAN